MINTKLSKPDLTLLPASFLTAVTAALEDGARKYSRRGYLDVEQYDVQAFRALLRHVLAILNRETHDPESGLTHLAHIGANVAMILDIWDEGCVTPTFPEPEEVPVQKVMYEYCARCGVRRAEHGGLVNPHPFVETDEGSLGLA